MALSSLIVVLRSLPHKLYRRPDTWHVLRAGPEGGARQRLLLSVATDLHLPGFIFPGSA